MLNELVAYIVEQLGIGAIVALFVALYERSRRTDKRLDYLERMIREKMERLERQLERLSDEIDELYTTIHDIDKRVTWLYARLNNAGREGGGAGAKRV